MSLERTLRRRRGDTSKKRREGKEDKAGKWYEIPYILYQQLKHMGIPEGKYNGKK